MAVDINVALFAEGSTDMRFLKGIIKRTLEDIYAESDRDAEIFEPVEFDKPSGADHIEIIKNAAKEADGWILMVYHTDADHLSLDEAYKQRIEKGIKAVEDSTEELNKYIVPCIPKNMIENWILVDKDELKKNIGTDKSFLDLGMDYSELNVETLGHGKDKLNTIIQKANEDNKGRAKKRLNVDISELYKPKGEEIQLDKLKQLPSYIRFRNSIVENLRKQNLLQ